MEKMMKKQNKMTNKLFSRYKITIINRKEITDSLLKSDGCDLPPEFLRDCADSHILAVKLKRGYIIVKHIAHRVPIRFKSKKDLLEHISEYI
jgi:hypothetical protein